MELAGVVQSWAVQLAGPSRAKPGPGDKDSTGPPPRSIKAFFLICILVRKRPTGGPGPPWAPGPGDFAPPAPPLWTALAVGTRDDQ
ncbi:unnamed protein product, partial [Nesidiocoris tenuis]